MKLNFIHRLVFLTAWMVMGPAVSGDMNAFFPEAGTLEGWTQQEKPKHYQSQNLYEYIDGEAELYLSYDFRELAAAGYFKGSPADTFITVDCYDMGDPLNAFGLYSNYRYPGYAYERIGTEGFVSDFGLTFVMGRYFVEIKSSDTSETCRRAARKISQIISGRIPDRAEFPPQVYMMPASGQSSKTLKYFARDMLNQAFLPEGFEAKYAVGDGEATGFAVLFKTAKEAEEGLKKLKAFFLESGALPQTTTAPPENALTFKTPYHGFTLLALNGKVLYGVQDLAFPEKGFPLITTLKQSAQKLTNSEGHGAD
jgi:hypothetical protein